MLNKQKQLFIGILIGILIMVAIPVGATVQEYILKQSDCKVVVDGIEFKDKKLPMLIMDPGYNYIAVATFREICEKIGIGFKFDSPTKEIRIDTNQIIGIVEPTPSMVPIKQATEEKEEFDLITQTPDGITQIEKNWRKTIYTYKIYTT